MYELLGKRLLDIPIAIFAITVFIFPIIFIATLVRLDSKGPAVFRQKRYGRNKIPFTIYKFRTMSTCAPSNMATNSFTDSKRYITRVGRILRKYSFDEIPQVFNVLLGHIEHSRATSGYTFRISLNSATRA